MKKLKFECELLSDVVINQSAATEGNNKTLDFIPGNSFLGIMASHYAEFSSEEALLLFHSGKVRFGDAHPESLMKSDIRTLRVPASLYYPKLKSVKDVCYVHHFYDRKADKLNDGRPQQLKQCRNGFFAFAQGKGFKAITERNFYLKSAYDRDRRRSKDEQMYGYESLEAGGKYLFEVETDDDSLVETIIKNLVGKHHIGRSRTAQYGEVRITEKSFEESVSRQDPVKIRGNEYVVVYADGRLIFLDENLEPTYRPTAEELGISGGEIAWDLSQVRTFQYAPWNGKRASRDTDRTGIEKGSVFLVKVNESNIPELKSRYIGVYKNEGFGKVIYNPDFLDVVKDGNGEAKLKIQQCDIMLSQENSLPLSGTPLLDFIARKRCVNEAESFVYEKVNEFVEVNKNSFSNGADKFSSQWGQIREIATRSKTYEKIISELFGANGYLCHGVAKEKWEEKGRSMNLRLFLKTIRESFSKYGDISSMALVNLASEMAKKK